MTWWLGCLCGRGGEKLEQCVGHSAQSDGRGRRRFGLHDGEKAADRSLHGRIIRNLAQQGEVPADVFLEQFSQLQDVDAGAA